MKSINKLLNNIINSENELTKPEKKDIKKKIKDLVKEENLLKDKILKYEMVLEYNTYKENGFKVEEIQQFYQEDQKIIIKAKEYNKKFNKLKFNMFGYPANMETKNYIEKYLRAIDDDLPFSNNCGEPFSELSNCNYAMDTKKIEFEIVKLVCQNLNFNINEYEGYITTGGTEGNFYGIKKGIETFNNGVIYFSETAHYSISKFVNLIAKKQNYTKIPIKEDGSINSEMLVNIIEKNWLEKKQPAIIILTWGTTTTGAVDDIFFIKEHLSDKNIPHYIHLDSAFYGGIPKNQKNAPLLKSLNSLKIDSISVSLHKYIGCNFSSGVVLSRKSNTNYNYISYINQKDTTILGSRSIQPFSTFYHINRFFNRSTPNKYSANVIYFQRLLEKNKISYYKNSNGNIFVLKNINDNILKKYQLATFDENLCHIIIMPFHKKKHMKELVKDLKLNS